MTYCITLLFSPRQGSEKTNNSTICGDEEDTPEVSGCLNWTEVRKSATVKYTVHSHTSHCMS